MGGLKVSLSPAQSWAPGTYRFTLQADGQTETCTGSLPLPPCDQGRALACTGPALARIGESGCALAATAQGFSSIDLDSSPAQLSVQIERDGRVIGSASLAPTYLTLRPNGPACEPVCRQASATIAVAAR